MNFIQKISRVVLFPTVLVLLVAACGGGARPPASPRPPSPAGTAEPALNDAFPGKELNYILAFAPGGESDITARMQQNLFEEICGQKFIVDYKEGGGGAVGWAELTNAPPDGYTFAGINEPHSIVQPLQRDDAGFKTEDLERICLFQYTSRIFLVPANSPYQTLDELIAACKERPGAVTIGGSGTWSASHIAFMLFEKYTGAEATYVTYSGTGEAKSDLLGNHIDVYIGNTPEGVDLGGQARVLAIASRERNAMLPDAPTFTELGYPIVEGSYRGVAAPPGTPEERVRALADIFKQINETPSFKSQMTDMGFDIIYLGPEEYDAFIAEKMVFYKELMEEFGA